MNTEDDYIQISALQHYVFCPRQCALIHVEGLWQDNLYTVKGEILHEKVDTDTYETRGTLKTVRGLRIHSSRLGIVGRCDVVEFRSSREDPAGQEVMPVEFKSGQPKDDLSDKVQLCAQALCLEEMLGGSVKQGVFFYGRIRRRVMVEFDDGLRGETERCILAVREIVSKKSIPAARYMEKCKRCSLESVCMPKAMNEGKLQRYLEALYSP